VFLEEEEEEDHVACSIANLKIFERSSGFERERAVEKRGEEKLAFLKLRETKDKNCEIFCGPKTYKYLFCMQLPLYHCLKRV
jgi:hypothetical protein